MSPAAGRSFQPGMGLGLESLAFCTLPKPHNPKKSHPQLLDPKGNQKAQVENFLAPAITTWVIGPAVGGWPDPWIFPPPKSAPHTTLWALEEHQERLGATLLCLGAKFPTAHRQSANTQSSHCLQSRESSSVFCHHFCSSFSHTISPPVSQLWPCQYQQFESLH